MNLKLLITIICIISIYNIYYEKSFLISMKKYKKYYKIAVVTIMGLGAMSILKKSPKMTYENMDSLQNFIQVLPIDKNSKDMLTPFLESSGYSQNTSVRNAKKERAAIEKIQKSGSKTTKRSVSETKKKYVASSQNWTCNKCNQKLNHTFEVDHMIRLENGGTNEVSNLEALCRECHGQKTSFENF